MTTEPQHEEDKSEHIEKKLFNLMNETGPEGARIIEQVLEFLWNQQKSTDKPKPYE